MYKHLSAPLTAQIEITGACNHICKHCYNAWREKGSPQGQGRLSVEQALSIMNKLSAGKVFEVILTGGEPLLNREVLFTVMEMAKERGIGVSINSNLSLLTESDASRIKSGGARGVLTSLLGPTPEVHDNIVGVNGSFHRVVAGIQLAQRADLKVAVNMVLTKLNIGHLEETAKLVHSFGVKTFAATKAGCPGNCNNFSGLSLSTEEYQEYILRMDATGKALGLKTEALEAYPLCGSKDLHARGTSLGRRCLAGVTTITVGNDGQVRPCSHLDIAYGNLLTEDLPAIWGRMGVWRSGELLPPLCQSCELLLSCGAGCRMNAKMATGSIRGMDPFSNPSNVPECKRQLKQTREEQKNIPTENPQSIQEFRLAEIKWRKEPFGLVIVTKDRKRVLLDKRGASLVQQLHPGIVYSMNDAGLEWGELEPRVFLSALSQKGVVILRRSYGGKEE